MKAKRCSSEGSTNLAQERSVHQAWGKTDKNRNEAVKDAQIMLRMEEFVRAKKKIATFSCALLDFYDFLTDDNLSRNTITSFV